MFGKKLTRLIADKQRFVPIMFVRAEFGSPPHPDYPDIDDRGYSEPYEGPVVGVSEGRRIKVMLLRLNIDNNSPIFIKSTDPSIARIEGLKGGALPSGSVVLEIVGVSGGELSRDTSLTVHFNSLAGPIIGRLFVQVYMPLQVRVTNHLLTIDGRVAGGGVVSGEVPDVDVGLVFGMAKTIWMHYGIELIEEERLNHRVTFEKVNAIGAVHEVAEALLAERRPQTINAYFVRECFDALGYGISRQFAAQYGEAMFRGHRYATGIIIAGKMSGWERQAFYSSMVTYAHEVGHFLGLWHPGVKSKTGDDDASVRQDTWARRTVMHNYILSDSDEARVAFGYQNYRPRFSDVGYGLHCNGCMVTIKDLPGIKTDGEVAIARKAILDHEPNSPTDIYDV